MIAFEWDIDKARANVRKHGVTFEEARSCFYDPRQIVFYDPDHSDDEDRELLIAHSNQGRVLIISYTLKTEVIRIISARKATKSEEIRYAQGI
ncbi:BrnT family toxin [Leptospirillum ferriphilum]|uniref:BrnT family toxin n=1 Tax=Leptospirillum ferriphilum TaxID=178606 RepID=UPI001C4DDD66|nr:BrnT family toxin [Leptospirillum ferriphilum]